MRFPVYSIPKTQSEQRLHTQGDMFKDWRKALADSVDFAAAVELDVLWGYLPVQRQVSCGSSQCHTESTGQIGAANLSQEVEPEVDIGQPFALDMAQAFDAPQVHDQAILTQRKWVMDLNRLQVLLILSAKCHQYDDILLPSSTLSKGSNHRVHALDVSCQRRTVPSQGVSGL